MFHISHSVDDNENKTNLNFNCLQSLNECHEKTLKECAMLDYDKVVTCSREPIIKIFDIGGDGNKLCEFAGHEMAINTIGVKHDGKYIASGSRDCTTRLWDIEK